MILILQILALVCWIIATLGLSPNPRINFWYAGWTLLLISVMAGSIALHPVTLR